MPNWKSIVRSKFQRREPEDLAILYPENSRDLDNLPQHHYNLSTIFATQTTAGSLPKTSRKSCLKSDDSVPTKIEVKPLSRKCSAQQLKGSHSSRNLCAV